MTKTKETIVVEEFDENGKIIKPTTTTKESTQDDYYRPGDWWQNQSTCTYRGYTGDTITTATATNKEADDFEKKLYGPTVAVNRAGERVVIPPCGDELPGQMQL